MNQREAHDCIMRLLRERHREDIWDTEVLVGVGGSRRMDFWAAACSWSMPLVTGYEVKVARQDFIRDDKWPAYLPHCRQLVFVTAPGIATTGEIPDECGWQELSKNGARLLTRKKAPARAMDERNEARIYKLILMRKSGLGNERGTDFWRRWMADKRESRKLGRLARYEVAATVAEQLRKARGEMQEMELRCARAETVEKAAARMGVDIHKATAFSVERDIRRIIATKNAGPIEEALAELDLQMQDLRSKLASVQNISRRLQSTIDQETMNQKTA